MFLASYGLGLIVSGLFIIFGGSFYSIINMYLGATRRVGNDNAVKRHFGAMIVIATGGFLTAMGLVLAGAGIVNRLIK